jgi:hypothetical protein
MSGFRQIDAIEEGIVEACVCRLPRWATDNNGVFAVCGSGLSSRAIGRHSDLDFTLVAIGLNIYGYSAPSASDLAQVALGGAGQGLPPLHGESGIQTLFNQGAQIGSHSAGWDGAAGIAVDHIVEAGRAAAPRVLPAAAVGRVASLGLKATDVAAYSQLALDLGTTAYGYFFACR